MTSSISTQEERLNITVDKVGAAEPYKVAMTSFATQLHTELAGAAGEWEPVQFIAKQRALLQIMRVVWDKTLTEVGDRKRKREEETRIENRIVAAYGKKMALFGGKPGKEQQ